MKPAFTVERSNVVLYCRHWQATATFYRQQVGLPVAFENDWFVEFSLNEQTFLSIADSRRATVEDVQGQGITLTWRVADIQAARAELQRRAVDVTPIRRRWGSLVCYFRDPEGHRIELWQAAESQPAP